MSKVEILAVQALECHIEHVYSGSLRVASRKGEGGINVWLG